MCVVILEQREKTAFTDQNYARAYNCCFALVCVLHALTYMCRMRLIVCPKRMQSC